jgi:hypothetical protein
VERNSRSVLVFGLGRAGTGRKPEPLVRAARWVHEGQETRMAFWEVAEGPPL